MKISVLSVTSVAKQIPKLSMGEISPFSILSIPLRRTLEFRDALPERTVVHGSLEKRVIETASAAYKALFTRVAPSGFGQNRSFNTRIVQVGPSPIDFALERNSPHNGSRTRRASIVPDAPYQSLFPWTTPSWNTLDLSRLLNRARLREETSTQNIGYKTADVKKLHWTTPPKTVYSP